MNPQKRQEFVACYEAYYWRYGFVPNSSAQLNNEFSTDFLPEDYEEVLTKPSLQNYFQERAVPNPYTPQPTLLPKQLDFIRLLLDPTQTSVPLAVKLRQAKTSQAELAAWMRDATFAKLLRDETTSNFSSPSTRSQVLNALANQANKGNVTAIKLYLEMTGEYVPSNQGSSSTSVNVSLNSDLKEITQKLLEVLQRHLTPELLQTVAGELEAVLFPSLPTPTPTPQSRQQKPQTVSSFPSLPPNPKTPHPHPKEFVLEL